LNQHLLDQHQLQVLVDLQQMICTKPLVLEDLII
jgi:hypothetical protein